MRFGISSKKLFNLLLVLAVSATWIATSSVSAVAFYQTNPTSPAVDKDLQTANQRVREGKVDEAYAALKTYAAAHAESPPPYLMLAKALFAADQAAPGRQALEKAAVEAPDCPEVFLAFGALALAEGRYNDARLNLEKALAPTAEDKRSDAQKRATILEAKSGLATVAEARGQWKLAQTQLNALLELDPKNGLVRQRLGRALFQLGNVEEAFAALTQATKDTPALEPAAWSMALLYDQKADVKKAQEWFVYAEKLDPKNAPIRLAHANWLLNQGQLEDARTSVDVAAELDPNSKETSRLNALIAWYLRDLATAEKLLEPLHRDVPGNFAVADLLALTLVEQDDKAKQSRGLQLAEVNARQFPRSAGAIATLGWANYRSGHLDEAEKFLRAAVNGVRTTPDVAYYFARVLSDKGKVEDARKILESTAALPGPFAHRADAKTLLASFK